MMAKVKDSLVVDPDLLAPCELEDFFHGEGVVKPAIVGGNTIILSTEALYEEDPVRLSEGLLSAVEAAHEMRLPTIQIVCLGRGASC